MRANCQQLSNPVNIHRLNKKILVGIFITLTMLAASQVAWGVDRYLERRLTQQLGKHIKIGQPLHLPLEFDDFFAIYTEATTPKSRGGAILIHGLGAHADWPQMISPLRRQLPGYGWNTLSIQISLVKDNASRNDYLRLYQDTHKRIKSAINYFEKRGIYNIVLIGHSLGASMALTYVNNVSKKPSGVIAIVGVSMYDHTELPKKYMTANAVASIKIPVLDIFGSRDNVEIQKAVHDRKLAAQKSGNPFFTQLEINGADHFFTGLESKLLKRIRVWINNRAPSMEIEIKRNE